MKIDNKYCYDKSLWLKPNNYLAQQLQPLYYENMVSFLQFSYQSFLLLPFGEVLGKIFDQIASEDLFHAKNIAESIVMLGGNPVLQNQDGFYFNSKQINQNQNPKKMLENSITQKEESIINLKTTLIKIDNKYIKNLLNSIISDEEIQLETLKTALEKTQNEQTNINIFQQNS